jgi:Nucleoside 2-deoxyribosyltransferase
MKIYLAGPLFTEADRAFLEGVAQRLEADGIECFVPHRQHFESFDPDTIFAADVAGVRDAHAVVAWLDGPVIDDGTAAEIGIFSELCRSNPSRHLGIVGLVTDWRTMRRRAAGTVADGLNLFVVGAIQSCGRLVYSVDDVVAAVGEWASGLDR